MIGWSIPSTNRLPQFSIPARGAAQDDGARVDTNIQAEPSPLSLLAARVGPVSAPSTLALPTG